MVDRPGVFMGLAIAASSGFAAHFLRIAAAPALIVRALRLGGNDFWALPPL